MKILLCIYFLIFCSGILFCQPVEEVIVIEKFEDNISNPINSLYFLENRTNSLNINTEKRHFLHQSDDNLKIDKAQILGKTLNQNIENFGKPQDFSVIASSKMQYMKDSHSYHLGFINTPTFQMYSGILTTIKERFYTIAQPTIKLSTNYKIFFPFAFNYNYNTDNAVSGKAGVGFQYNQEEISVTTTAMSVFDFDIKDSSFAGGLEAVNQLKWKNIINHAELFVTNKEASIKDTFTFTKNFFFLNADSNFTFKYYTDKKLYFSMNHSFMAAFFFKNISIFTRYYTSNNEDDIEKDINEITPWKRRLNAQMSDYTMDYIGTEWYSGGQIRWKHKKLLLEASSYAASNNAVSSIKDSKWLPAVPFFVQLLTAGFYNDFIMLRFSPFLCIGNEILDYGIHSNIDISTKHNIRIQTNNGVKISGAAENIKIDNEIKLGYCLLKHWYLYHSAYFCNKYNFLSQKYSLEGKICGGASFQF